MTLKSYGKFSRHTPCADQHDESQFSLASALHKKVNERQSAQLGEGQASNVEHFGGIDGLEGPQVSDKLQINAIIQSRRSTFSAFSSCSADEAVSSCP